MTPAQIGQLAALLTAICWTASAVAWTSAGKHIGSLPVSFLRLVITTGLLAGYELVFHGAVVPQAGSRAWLLLSLSGVMGFFISDLCLFTSLLLIGPRLALLIQALTPPTTAILDGILYGRELSAWAWLGMAVTLSGVAWVVLERPDPNGPAAPHRPHAVRGVVLAVTSALTQALGSVWAKEGIAPGDDPFSATFIRVLGALAGFAVLITVAGRWRPVLAAARHGRAMRTMVAGAIVGPFAGVVFYMAAMQRCPAGVVTTMVATMPIFILVPAAFLYHERIGYRAIGGAVVSLIGVALLSM